MEQKPRVRFIISFVLIAILFIVCGAQLSRLTMSAQAGELSVASEDKKLRAVTLKGTRGQILDITGIPLAYDRISYNIEFTRDPSKNTTTDRAYYTDILIRTIDMIEQNEGAVIDTFSIVRNERGEFEFDFGITDPEAVERRRENWCKNMFINVNSTPDAIYRDLRNRYRIPEEYTYEKARKLLSIWQEVQLSSYRAYVPVTVATNVPIETVAVIEAASDRLDGISVAQSSTRVYPKDDVAAHIVGYMGKMVDETTVKDMVAQGYSQDDQIGVTGIESTMESYLTGNSTQRQGERRVEVNSKGKVIQELSYTPPAAGDNVMLTIDLELQMEAEKAIGSTVEWVHGQQVERYNAEPEKYDDKLETTLKNREGDSTMEKLNLAQSGAIVVMDVHTGDVLAMASYPSYDLNLFSGGISTADYDALKDDKSSPLFNKAIASKGIPGSVFKMVTGTAGLAEGVITDETVINDESPYDKYIKQEYIMEGGRAPSCWTEYPENHAHDQTIREALAVSCNYYFFEVADRLGEDKLIEWSDRFGLMTKTNVELPGEESGQVGSQEVLYNPEKTVYEQKTAQPKLVRDQILGHLKEYGAIRNVDYDAELLEGTADEIVKLASNKEEALGPQIRALLSEKMEIPETITRRNSWDIEINSLLTQLQWNPTRTVLTGIGTGLTAVTPIAMARYTAALVNGGTVYNAHVVDSIVDANGNVVQEFEPDVWSQINAPGALEVIKEGMKDVVSAEDGSTASEDFKDWEYKDDIGGKTGTGRVNDIDLENNAWFVAFAPYEEPEIAVVVYIPNGIGGNYAIPAVKDIISYYFESREPEPDANTPTSNSLLS